MKTVKVSLVMAIKEHILKGNPITQLEGICLFGVADITPTISDLRRDGYKIDSTRVPYVRALRRLNESANLTPPKNLPVKEIALTEYVWCGL